MKLIKFKNLIAFFIIFFQTFETQSNSEESKNLIAEIKWEKFKKGQNYYQPTWIKHDASKEPIYSDKKIFNSPFQINSLNRSLVFDNKIIGPDVHWLVPQV